MVGFEFVNVLQLRAEGGLGRRAVLVFNIERCFQSGDRGAWDFKHGNPT